MKTSVSFVAPATEVAGAAAEAGGVPSTKTKRLKPKKLKQHQCEHEGCEDTAVELGPHTVHFREWPTELLARSVDELTPDEVASFIQQEAAQHKRKELMTKVRWVVIEKFRTV